MAHIEKTFWERALEAARLREAAWPGKEPDLVDRIEEVRRQNNSCWMDLLRLALQAEPDQAKAILLKIKQNDSEVQKLLGELASD